MEYTSKSLLFRIIMRTNVAWIHTLIITSLGDCLTILGFDPKV